MAAIFIVIFAVICIWTGLLSSWTVAYATGLAQLGIWATLLSLVPFVSIWVSLKQGALTEIPQSSMRTHWSCSLKASKKNWRILTWTVGPVLVPYNLVK